MNEIKAQVMVQTEATAGGWYCHVVPRQYLEDHLRWSAVLGRGVSESAAVENFIARATWDGLDVSEGRVVVVTKRDLREMDEAWQRMAS